jgi:hypothetical protein
VIPSLGRAARIQLLVIRTAMLLGVLLFGAVTWYTKRQEHPAILTPATARAFGYIFAAIACAAVAGLMFMRTRLETTTEQGQLLVLYVVGYALAEGAAVFGGVVWFLGGAQAWYIAGLILMVVAFQVLPVEASRE